MFAFDYSQHRVLCDGAYAKLVCMQQIFDVIVRGVDWVGLFYLVIVLCVLLFLKVVLGYTLHDFVRVTLHEITLLVSRVKSPASANALTLVMMFILILLLFSGSIIREIHEIMKILWRGTSGVRQETMVELYAVGLLGGVGLLSVVAARSR